MDVYIEQTMKTKREPGRVYPMSKTFHHPEPKPFQRPSKARGRVVHDKVLKEKLQNERLFEIYPFGSGNR